MDVTIKELMAASCAFWVKKSEIQLPSGPFSFVGREYLVEPINEDVELTCDIKATQGGFTVKEVLKCLHGMIHGRYPQGVLYLFPTGNDVSDFSKSRFNPIITDNHVQIGRFVKSTDSVTIKKIGKSFLYLRGARLSQAVETEKESAQLRSISVDRVVYDEYDLMSDEVRQKAYGRMGASEVKQEAYLSNPTIPDYGIDKVFQTTDQRHWMIRCERCNDYTCLEDEFPECIRLDNEGKGVRICIHCKAPIDRCKGEWVPKYPSIKNRVGRRWSQLNSPTVDPATILHAYRYPKDGNLGDVNRLMLGRAYIEAENRLTKQDVYACCSPEGIYPTDQGPCAMGVDVGKLLHVVIARRQENGVLRLVYAGRHTEAGDLKGLGERYHVSVGAIDLYPETRMVRDLQAVVGFPLYGIQYQDKQLRGVIEDQEVNVLKAGRTETMDAVHNLYSERKIILPRRSTEMDEYAEEMTNTAKMLNETDRGDRIYRYRKLGADHYYHATNCMNIVIDRVAAGHLDIKVIPVREKYHPIWSGLRRKRA